MLSLISQRRACSAIISPSNVRFISTSFSSQSSEPTAPLLSESSLESSAPPPNTHFKITLRRSVISLGERKKGTLVSLGIHRRMQTVYHPHSPIVAGKILQVKELVEVENVPAHMVRSKVEQTRERRAPRGFVVEGSKLREQPF